MFFQIHGGDSAHHSYKWSLLILHRVSRLRIHKSPAFQTYIEAGSCHAVFVPDTASTLERPIQSCLKQCKSCLLTELQSCKCFHSFRTHFPVCLVVLWALAVSALAAGSPWFTICALFAKCGHNPETRMAHRKGGWSPWHCVICREEMSIHKASFFPSPYLLNAVSPQ